MIIKQVSVFLENKSGRLSEVTRILGDAGINISAFTIADTSDFGILRMVLSDPDKACTVLKASDFSVKTTDVLLANSSNKPGGLAELLELLNAKGAFIEYMYAFSMNDNKATIVIRPTNIQKCAAILEEYKG
ncbi:ACT domain-containing protein [Maribellus sp. YY47]|uniref:ACT domain-containing protein n=1 Tax=Maribellus sp. YY47 TaxID=2929486 RepID=UPI0020014E76|nr:ACT domain-containing protein [Maribellus sp. YY47]MCK3684113.1 ACT domain-containing protein [Maribellus sp. YY47]